MGCGCGGNKNLGGARNMRRVGGGPFANVVRTESANPPAPNTNNNVVIPNNFTERERIQRLRRAAIERATGKKMF